MTLLGKTIGHIRILDILGQGGMGEVYAGFDDTLKRKVAVKAIGAKFRLDPQSKARFLREARVLSQLKHPNICQIYDYIEGEEGDYLILEFIDGINLRQAIHTGIEKLRKLQIAEQISQVLVNTHQKGVVHRDLKPSNVMLTENNKVKVLDFGLAGYTKHSSRDLMSSEIQPEEYGKSETEGDLNLPEFTLSLVQQNKGDAEDSIPEDLDQVTVKTQHGSVMGTPLYMSPEQAQGKTIHTASDIYSFGLLLQTLFTGLEPYEDTDNKTNLLISVKKGETRPVSGLSSDLTSLINRLKSFAPASRPTAIETLERLHLIREKPKRRIQRLIAAIIVAAFIFGGVKYTLDLRREQKLAFEARDEATGVVDFLIDLFEVSDPGEARGNTITAREILRRGADEIEQGLQRQPLTRARLMDTIGIVYRKLGLYAEAEPLIKKAYQIRKEQLEKGDVGIAESLMSLSILNERQGHYDDAEELVNQALLIRKNSLAPDHPQCAECLHHLALIKLRQSILDEAKSLFLQALDIREKAFGPDHPDVAETLRELGIVYYNQGQYEEAEPIYQRALSIRETVLGRDHPDVGRTLNSLGALYYKLGRYSEAESYYRRALSIREKTLGRIHPEVAICINNIAHIFYNQRRIPEAEALYREALEIREEALGRDHPDVAESYVSLANLFLMDNRLSDAEAYYKNALIILEKSLKPGHPRVAECLNNLAILYFYQDDFKRAEDFYKRSITIREQSLGPNHLNVAYSLSDLAYLYFEYEKLEEAESLYHRALSIYEHNLGLDHFFIADILDSICSLYEKLDSYIEAEKYARRALKIRIDHPGRDPAGLTITFSNLAVLNHRGLKKYEEAESFYRQALSLMEENGATNSEEFKIFLENYTELLRTLNREEDAQELIERFKIKLL